MHDYSSLVQLSPGARRERVGSLAPLLEAVLAARMVEREQLCRRGMKAPELASARGKTLGALENYAAALVALAWPVPRGVLQEIRLHRALLGVRERAAPSGDLG
jgi:hypothetical protein